MKLDLSERGYQLILDFEVGGGESYYTRFLAKPTLPPGFSGITVGIGYDLGYHTAAQISQDWAGKPYTSRLAALAGLKQQAAATRLKSVADIIIPWLDAKGVFDKTTLPRFFSLAQTTFPGFNDLNSNTKAALVSLVFNRGASMAGPTRVEMVRIRTAVAEKDYKTIAEQLRKMKRLWASIPGLQRRREAEAQLVEGKY